MSDLDAAVREIAAEMAARSDQGEVANYIPELARVDAGAFGMVAIDAEGQVAAAGDGGTPFSIQSISKVFTLTLALGMIGDRLWRRVGREGIVTSAKNRRLLSRFGSVMRAVRH